MAADAGALCARAVLWTALPIAIVMATMTDYTIKATVAMALVAMFAASAAALCVADADMPLLMRGKHAANAYAGKVCVVVGASRGFGAALATHLARSGASLVLCARGTAQLQVRDYRALVPDRYVKLMLLRYSWFC